MTGIGVAQVAAEMQRAMFGAAQSDTTTHSGDHND
jgi:hypothetical protein